MTSDGRMFGWQRTRGGARDYTMPVIVWDRKHGCSNVEFAELNLMKPHEYGLSLPELEAIYPTPKVTPDHKETT